MPLEVLSTACAGASTTSSAGAPSWSTTACWTSRSSAARVSGSLTRVSARTTNRSVPLASSVAPKTATQPLRTPSSVPTAASTSCG
jgi:hypothetical protein